MRFLVVVVLAAFLSINAPGSAEAGRLSLVAGGGTGGDGSSATQARITSPFGVEFTADGTLYFVEMTGHRLRKIDRNGKVTTIAGSGEAGDGGDGGLAAGAKVNGMHSLAITRNDDIFIADTWNNRVRKIDARTGHITTVVGTGRKGFSGDGGPATKADFGGIYCLALDEDKGALYLADLDNRRIRVLDLKTGIVSTVAGNGKKGIPEDGADAR
ncbi:NHL domain-containing protein, partial [Singulisphaera rosea]